MGQILDGDTLRELAFGRRVNRATAALPATAAAAIFTIAGGRVAITQIVGEVTTIIQTQADSIKLIANPTVGTSVDMCAALNVSADEVGCLYGITGVPADALIGTNAGLVPGQTKPQILNVGTIDLDATATNTGSVKWTLFYTPIDDGATVVAA